MTDEPEPTSEQATTTPAIMTWVAVPASGFVQPDDVPRTIKTDGRGVSGWLRRRPRRP